MSPLALEMLAYFCTRAVPEADPFPNIGMDSQQDIVRQFLDDEVIRTTGHKDKPMATAKGQAWLKLILETPMPVQQWIDPRGAEPVYEHRRHPPDGEVDPRLYQDQGRVFSKPAPVAPPAGYAPNKGIAMSPPEGLQGTDHAEVYTRKGEYKSGAAALFNWKHYDNPDDIIGWKQIAAPENKIHIGNTGKK